MFTQEVGDDAVMSSLSQDGLTWSTPTSTGLRGGDPVAVQLMDRSLRLYFNDGDPRGSNANHSWAVNKLFTGRLAPSSWDVSITYQPKGGPGSGGTYDITLDVTGSGGPITVELTDMSRSQVRPASGLPQTMAAPFSAKFTVASEDLLPFVPLISVSDGTVTRYFLAHGCAGSICP